MGVEFESDLAAFTSAEEFGDEMRGPSGRVSVVFDTQYVDANGVEQTSPSAYCRLSGLADAGVINGASVTLKDVEYTVRRIEPDGPDGVFGRVVLSR